MDKDLYLDSPLTEEESKIYQDWWTSLREGGERCLPLETVQQTASPAS
jgi:hypothetical protein